MKKRYALEYHNTKKILRWKPVFYISMFFFYWFFQLSLNNSLLPYYIAKYSISSQGLFASLPLIGNLLLFVPAGIIVDRYDIAKIVKTSIMVIVSSIIVVELTTLKSIAYASFLVIGFAGSFSMLSCIRIANDCFTPKNVGLPISISITIAFLGSYFGNIISGFLLDIFQNTFPVNLSNILLGLFINIFCIRNITTNKKKISSKAASLDVYHTILNVLKKEQNWIVSFYIALMNIPVMILGFSFGQSYLNNVFSVSAKKASLIASAISLGCLIGGPIWNKLACYIQEKYESRRTLMFVLTTAYFFLTLSLFISSNKSSGFLTTVFFHIGFLGSVQTLCYPIIASNNDPRSIASTTSLTSIIIMSSSVLLQILFGKLETSYSYHSAYGLIPLCVLFSFILIFFISDQPSKKTKYLT